MRVMNLGRHGMYDRHRVTYALELMVLFVRFLQSKTPRQTLSEVEMSVRYPFNAREKRTEASEVAKDTCGFSYGF